MSNAKAGAMTPAMQRILDATQAGPIRVKAISRRPLQALEKLGLVTSIVEVQPDTLHGRHTLIYTVTKKD